MTFDEWLATAYRLLPEGSDALKDCWEAAYEAGYKEGRDREWDASREIYY
jgi:maltoporin